jgi:hypothetical protein
MKVVGCGARACRAKESGFQLKEGLNRVFSKGRRRVAKWFCRHLHSLIRFPKNPILGDFPSRQIFQALAESLIDHMIGCKLPLRYDPNYPEMWFIPDEFIDGYKVEQKIGSHVIHDYSPND